MAETVGHKTEAGGKADPSCLFCKIIAAQIPSFKVFEDDTVFAFLDINPIVRGHLMVIPKRHYASLLDTPPALLAAIAQRLPRLAQALLQATGTHACHVLTNIGEESGQSIHHLHYHILPRHAADGYTLNWPTTKLPPDQAPILLAALHQALAQP